MPSELADSLLEGGDPLDGFLGPLGFQVTYLAEEFADLDALSEDFGVGGLEGGLGVQRSFAPGRLALIVLLSGHAALAFTSLSRRCGHRGSGLGVVVEEGA
ncbi:hypothetical protein [Streptomyces peucetius]|uniref:Uncharacterized protein n=1 Tax=Streptomyces peucetius TaxID=1950 RepID=A0ABY6I1E5_STRPE|nr:hypothetical protein [Streptomyces peucetius]UYQ60651.1 hypothetical protein OGH68_03655 [Streptomyces peucetius]